MNLLTLHYFCLAARLENVTQAAEQLYISQPALSKTIRQLESEVGAPLFERERGRIRLNPAGRFFYGKVAPAIGTIEDAIQTIRMQKIESTPDLRILSTVNPYFLPAFYSAFEQAYPEIRIKPSHSDSTRRLGQHYDLIFCTEAQRPEGYSFRLLLEESYLLAVPWSHPLSQYSVIDMRQTAPYGYLTMSEGSPLRQRLEACCTVADFSPSIAYECDTLQTYQRFLEDGIDALAFIPEKSLFHVDLQKFKKVAICSPSCRRKIILCWDTALPLRPEALLFRDFCIEFVQENLS